jgi:hypothetical protein
VALGGAGYNRSGEPESRLQLTQRELQHSSWREGRDNSGITLMLNWRFEQAEQNEYDSGRFAGRWGMPAWLDQAKMAELGFDVENLADTSGTVRRRRDVQMQSREVLLVLELNDQAYRRQLQRSEEKFAQARKLLEAAPASEDIKRKAKNAEENYQYEKNQGSRLFVIDAGLDVQKLRATYPDRARYAIVHGLVRPRTEWEMKNKASIGGNISELHADRINVPLAYRQVFGNPASYEVTVAFGKRLEPWLVSASKVAAAN